jgi:GrpB-like predicted nucleotidyltransferase (UPF0157 family)
MDNLTLIEYDADWPARFAAESQRIREALGGRALAIEHVGSTAVPGLGGKPVLDIAIAVDSFATAEACIAPLSALGYEYRGAHGDDPRRRYYVRNADGRRAVQIHMYVVPAPAYSEQLAFRDALRADPVLVEEYMTEKRRVAELVGWNKGAYSVTKGDFVQRVLERIRAATHQA